MATESNTKPGVKNVGKLSLTLGLKESEREAGRACLDQVFSALSSILAGTLILSLLAKGKIVEETYRRKLDITWEQVKLLGLRIVQLGGRPTMEANQMYRLAEKNSGGNLFDLIMEDLSMEDRFCAKVRELIGTVPAGDWSSAALLTDILSQREEIVHELDNTMDDPILEHIWEEDMSMKGKKSRHSPFH